MLVVLAEVKLKAYNYRPLLSALTLPLVRYFLLVATRKTTTSIANK